MKQTAKVSSCRNFITSDFYVSFPSRCRTLNTDTRRHLCIYATSSPLIVPFQNKLSTLILQKSQHTEKDLKSEREEEEQILCFQCNQDNDSSVSIQSVSQSVLIWYSCITSTKLCVILVQNKLFSVSFLLVFASNGSEASFCSFTVCHFQHSSGSNLLIIIIIIIQMNVM